MNNLHDMINLQAVRNIRKIFSKKWSKPLIYSLFIVFAGIFAIYHQTLSAGESTKPVELTYEQHVNNGQAINVEDMARGNDKLATKPSIWPTCGEVTSSFGWRNGPMGGGSEFHPGIDIANNMNTPIVATADGTVVKSGLSGGYGNIVQIDHGNGITTIYGHNSQVIVSVGQSVKKGQIISYMGSTGKSTGPHAHYEVRVNDTAVDPASFMVQY